MTVGFWRARSETVMIVVPPFLLAQSTPLTIGEVERVVSLRASLTVIRYARERDKESSAEAMAGRQREALGEK